MRVLAIVLAVAVAVVLAGNGIAMLFAGAWWYGVVPGVSETGPFNAHFVKDIGAAYVVAGAGFAAFAWRPGRMRPALALATGFLALHALIHIADAVELPGGAADIVRDLPGVFLPALIGIALSAASLSSKEPSHA